MTDGAGLILQAFATEQSGFLFELLKLHSQSSLYHPGASTKLLIVIMPNAILVYYKTFVPLIVIGSYLIKEGRMSMHSSSVHI